MQSDVHKELHVAIIMDGNGRWATRRGLPRVAGHRAGVATVRRVVEHAPNLGIRSLTLYAFSSDNWNRPADEVESLFWLLRAYLRMETERLRQNSVRLEIIGRRDRLDNLLLREISRAEEATAEGQRLHLRIAVDYSSRDAITRAAAGMVVALSPDRPTSSDLLRPMLAQALTAESGEVDLLIRTGGEKRLSDFLLWESAYAELLFTDRMWPDFDAADLDAALAEFKRRERRFGSVPAATTASHTGGAALTMIAPGSRPLNLNLQIWANQRLFRARSRLVGSDLRIWDREHVHVRTSHPFYGSLPCWHGGEIPAGIFARPQSIRSRILLPSRR